MTVPPPPVPKAAVLGRSLAVVVCREHGDKLVLLVVRLDLRIIWRTVVY